MSACRPTAAGASILLHCCWRCCLRVLTWPGASTNISRGLSSDHRALRLTARLKTRLSRLLQHHTSLVQRATSPEAHQLSEEAHRQLHRELSRLEPVSRLARELEDKQQELLELEQLAGEAEMAPLAQEELQQCRKELADLEASMVRALLPRDEADEHSAVLEVRAGVGGKEAALFTAEIFLMYQRFADHRGWQFETLTMDRSDVGGYKHASASLTGQGVFGVMKHERGVHRVQRVPVTEGAGRVHTSTMSVVLLPQPPEIEVSINPGDLKVETFRAGGAGGQHVNKTDSAVRLTHLPTGTVVSIQDERSQHRNRAKALQILRARLYEGRRREASDKRSEQRKQQIGTAERYERIRTYNFPQDRVTDHRLGWTAHGVQEFLEGSELLSSLLRILQEQAEEQALDSVG